MKAKRLFLSVKLVCIRIEYYLVILHTISKRVRRINVIYSKSELTWILEAFVKRFVIHGYNFLLELAKMKTRICIDLFQPTTHIIKG